jgi:cobalt/nickel transport system ATP-binding protein
VDLIQRLAAAGRTLIVATHELDIVPLIADRVVVLSEQGRVVADGSPAAILADRDLLICANLIHEHLHEHGAVAHSHPHVTAEGHLGGAAESASMDVIEALPERTGLEERVD